MDETLETNGNKAGQTTLIDHLPHVYLRGSIMHAPLPLSTKVNKKV